jgi:hypothetical protein
VPFAPGVSVNRVRSIDRGSLTPQTREKTLNG